MRSMKLMTAINGTNYTYKKTIIVAKLGITHVGAVDPTCTTDGNIKYWYDESSDKYFSDAEGKTEITKAQTVSTRQTLPHIITTAHQSS
ncbi:hypothetical protein [Ruminococcus sp. YE78]|uniref:hypothetical protein n=1 Tax=Ruminococcus sp. YE78 TaxID=1352374 RepID=UPI00088A7C84|nr:hypothetical protein [Ruminococcus sp. YE78]SDA32916.1 hypothetical protein SAMN02910446_03673 [Ruminococcus sp. YE78]